MKVAFAVVVLLDLGFAVVPCPDLPVSFVGATECQMFDTRAWRIVVDAAGSGPPPVNIDVELLQRGEGHASGPRPCTPSVSDFGGHTALVCVGRGLVHVRYDVVSMSGVQAIALTIGRQDATAMTSTSVEYDAYALDFAPSYVNVTLARSPACWIGALLLVICGDFFRRFVSRRHLRRA